MSGVQGYLDAKRTAMRAQRTRVASGEAAPKRVSAQVNVEGRAGVRRVRVRDFQFLTDSGPETGGFDLGPSPVEVLLGALGGCLAHTIVVQAALRGVPLDALSVDVSATVDPRAGHPAHPDVPVHPREIAYVARIDSPADEATVRALLDAAERVCPVTALLTEPQEVTGSLAYSHSGAAAEPVAAD